MQGCTPLVGTIGSFTQPAYRSIIDVHIIPFMEDVHGGSDGFVIHEDNCDPSCDRCIARYLDNKDISRAVWPPHGQDLNPFKNVGD